MIKNVSLGLGPSMGPMGFGAHGPWGPRALGPHGPGGKPALANHDLAPAESGRTRLKSLKYEDEARRYPAENPKIVQNRRIPKTKSKPKETRGVNLNRSNFLPQGGLPGGGSLGGSRELFGLPIWRKTLRIRPWGYFFHTAFDFDTPGP